MTEIDICRIADTLPLTWIAALLCNEMPSRVEKEGEHHQFEMPGLKKGAGAADTSLTETFTTALHCLIRAVERQTLPANQICKSMPQTRYSSGDRTYFENHIDVIDPARTTVVVDDLRKWLETRGVNAGFFFPNVPKTPDYLDPNHPKKSLKLHAAIRAWQAIATNSTYDNNGQSVKSNLEVWLTAHAGEFDLVKADGTEINKTAIADQISKVANWQDQGGAPRTPGS